MELLSVLPRLEEKIEMNYAHLLARDEHTVATINLEIFRTKIMLRGARVTVNR